MKRHTLLLFLTLCAGTRGFAATNPVDDLFKQAQTAMTARDFDTAVTDYEQVLEAHPEAMARWYDAQAGIAQALAKKGDLDGAVKAMHVCIDGAADAKGFDSAVSTAAAMMSALDGNVTHANQLIAYEQSGGTNGANPMEAVGYPDMTARAKAFEAVRAQSGDTAVAARLRAFTFLFTGKPKEALGEFADAFRRQSAGATQELVLVGLRAVHGHRGGLDKAMQFVIHGPAGADGKTGTEDDLADPFAEYLPAVPAAGQGGTAQLSPDDLAMLRKLHDASELYAGDSFVPPNTRHAALSALWRTNDALDNWGAQGQAEWFFGIEKYILNYYVWRNYQGEWAFSLLEEKVVGGMLAVGKGRALHLGGAQAALAALDAYCAEHNIKATDGRERARKQFYTSCWNLGKVAVTPLALKPLTAPAKF